MRSFFVLAVFLYAGFLFAEDYPIYVRGGDERSFVPPDVKGKPEIEERQYDAIVVGGGLGGLSAALFLSDARRSVLLLEKEEVLGGLAAGGALAEGIRYDRGAAYWTDANKEQNKILRHIGLGDFKKKHFIPEPIDSYLWNGKLYLGIWEHEETMKELPASFNLFRSELRHVEKAIANQPMEEASDLSLDEMDAAEWIRKMPYTASLRTDAESRALYEAYRADKRVPDLDPMKDVIDFLDLYCRSALGGRTEEISAMAFANFYISEITTRYTTEVGTGIAAEVMEKTLRKRKKTVELRTGATVRFLRQDPEGVVVRYWHAGQVREAKARYGVFASQLKFAPRLIEGFREAAPVQADLFEQLGYAHYSVHVAMTEGHPYRATYDTWTRALDYTESDFSDVILGRWMELQGYKEEPKDQTGILTMYHPLTKDQYEGTFDEGVAVSLARNAVERLKQIYNPFLDEMWGTEIKVREVHTSRWPFSIHVAKKGHFKERARQMRKPFGKIYFAHSNLGTPSFEEALFRGHCAANNILKKVKRDFRQERWTSCVLE